MPKSLSAQVFVALIVVSGVAVLAVAFWNVKSVLLVRFAAFLLVASLASRLRVKLPGVTGVMSVNLPFILVAAAEMGAAEALIVGLCSTLVQCWPRNEQRFNPAKAAFNCSVIMLAAAVTRLIFVSPAVSSVVGSPALRLAVAAVGYILVNTVTVATVIALTEGVSVVHSWLDMFQLSFPYLVASASIAGLALTVTRNVGWQVPVAVLPVMMGIHYSYRRYFGIPVTARADLKLVTAEAVTASR